MPSFIETSIWSLLFFMSSNCSVQSPVNVWAFNVDSPISLTSLSSFKNQLARDDERFNVTYSNKEKYQSLKLSFSRSSRSRWSKDGKGESDWEKQTKMLQNQQQDVPPQENM